MPWLIAYGWLPFYAYMLALSIPFVLMLAASLVSLRSSSSSSAIKIVIGVP